MTALFKSGDRRPTRHGDPDDAVARYLEQLHQADVAGAAPPPASLNGLGDAYLDKEDAVSAADYWRQAAEAYAREGMHSSAIACLKKVRRHAPDEGNVGLLLGRAYAAKGLTADALAELGGYLDRGGRTGGRRERIEALREIARLAPGRVERREELAALLLEDGQREAGLNELRAARIAYEEKGDTESARRLAARLSELGSPEPAAEDPQSAALPSAEAPPPAAPGPADAGSPTEAEPEPAEEDRPDAGLELDRGVDSDTDLGIQPGAGVEPDDAEPGAAREDEPAGAGAGFEIERTSYDSSGPVLDPEPELTIEKESVPPPHVARDPSIQPDDLSGAAPLEDAAAELEEELGPGPTGPGDPSAPAGPAAPEPAAPMTPPADLAELVDVARRQAQEGHREQAARNLLLAAEGLRAEERWADAIRAYRTLADIGAAKDEDLDDWAECARQEGRASEVLEALAVAARARLERDDPLGARRAAEAMLLVDPHNAVAAEVLERVGALPPGG